MALSAHPLPGRGGGFAPENREGRIRVIEMHAFHAKGITGTVNSGHVVGIVNVGEHQREIRLTEFEHVLQFCASSGSWVLGQISCV